MNTNCPQCEEGMARSCWTTGRMLRQECNQCDWVGDPYTPPQQPIETRRRYVPPAGSYGWHYKIFDQYGHCSMVSRSHSTEDECRSAAKKALHRLDVKTYGECTAVIWPPVTEVEGSIMRLGDNNG